MAIRSDSMPCSGAQDGIFLTVVIPVYNEEENVIPLHEGLRSALEPLAKPFEVVYVDDGSKDQSFTRLAEIARSDETVRVIRFRRNFGQTAAFVAGFDHARGQVIVTMDADLQNDPRDIPKLLAKIDEGYDLVSGWRVDRKDTFITRRVPSIVANWLIAKVTGVRLHDYGCSLKAYRSEVVKNLRLYGEMHRFIPALASSMGVEIAEVPVNHYPRRYGKAKYGLSRVSRVILDLLTVRFLLSYSARPMQIFGLLGLALFALGSLMGLYLMAEKYLFNKSIGDRPLLFLVVLLVVFGMQLVMMGLLGELMTRIYYEAQGKSTYVVREIVEQRAP